ncbi:hypothetical protein DNU06_04665 [Putridiphycobacter roseus]|uniref:Lipoprotein n=1 Tax=Putridiphycobacter roseus TaxID=2219161 RepID=A0A2W1NEP3_9FLAO|nr:hypothetical protein [Putridiphycobacter roseus]PZE17915.1 hypothetical protein DNU06_04665 [Putridiphycobacter roseus]
MRRLKYIYLLFIPLLLTSCFEFIEDISINEDGSGEITLILNASQSKSKLNSMLLLEEVEGYRVPSRAEIITKVKNLEDSLRKMPGFSAVSTALNMDNFVLKVHANFDKIERLNEVIFKLWFARDPVNAQRMTYYSFQSGTYIKQASSAMNYLQNSLKRIDQNSLEGSNYISLSRFQSAVSSQINAKSIVSKNNKVVFLKLPLTALINKPELFTNKIITHP